MPGLESCRFEGKPPRRYCIGSSRSIAPSGLVGEQVRDHRNQAARRGSAASARRTSAPAPRVFPARRTLRAARNGPSPPSSSVPLPRREAGSLVEEIRFPGFADGAPEENRILHARNGVVAFGRRLLVVVGALGHEDPAVVLPRLDPVQFVAARGPSSVDQSAGDLGSQTERVAVTERLDLGPKPACSRTGCPAARCHRRACGGSCLVATGPAKLARSCGRRLWRRESLVVPRQPRPVAAGRRPCPQQRLGATCPPLVDHEDVLGVGQSGAAVPARASDAVVGVAVRRPRLRVGQIHQAVLRERGCSTTSRRPPNPARHFGHGPIGVGSARPSERREAARAFGHQHARRRQERQAPRVIQPLGDDGEPHRAGFSCLDIEGTVAERIGRGAAPPTAAASGLERRRLHHAPPLAPGLDSAPEAER